MGGQRAITGMVRSAPATFRHGIYAENGITISGGTVTDGYNSLSGAYVAAAPDSTGSVATNGNITLSGSNTIVEGDAIAHGTASSGAVTGTRTSGAPLFPSYPTLACPTGGYSPNTDVPSGHGIGLQLGHGSAYCGRPRQPWSSPDRSITSANSS